MAKAIIFDMDGVIIDSEPVHNMVSKTLNKELGFEVSDEEYSTFIGRTDHEIYSILKIRHNLSQSVESIVDTYEKRFREYLKHSAYAKPIPGVVELIESLKQKGIPLALASSATKENIITVLELFNIKGFFQAVVSGCEVKNSKPFPDVFLKAAELLKVRPSDCIVIEDSSNGVKAAKAAGMTCVAFKNPNTGKQDLSLADIFVDRFDSKCLQWILNYHV